nr:helix-turn-helix domain-containing protein [Saccharothrix sp. 6-C]
MVRPAVAHQHAQHRLGVGAAQRAQPRREPRQASYQELLDEARAEELLTTNDLPVERIAARLGYGETAAFIHAFRRWHGTTPGDYGRRRRAG